jgi:hypothetical protein
MSAVEDTTHNLSIEEVARRLARGHTEAEPSIEEIYFFPDSKEVRLIATDTLTAPIGQIEPFYFAASPANGIPFPSAIALIHPSEKQLPTPEGWGAWTDAKRIWPEDQG